MLLSLNKYFHRPFLFLYYVAMMAFLLSWTNPDVAPPEAWRYGFLVALIIPLLFDGTAMTIAIISIFYTVSYYGYAFSYMPQSIMIYVWILVLCIFFNRKSNKKYYWLEGWRSFIFFGVYVIIINTLTSFAPLIANGGKVIFCILLPFFLTKDRNESLRILEHSFIIISIIMSIQYLMIGDQAILVQDQDGSGLTRTGWTDPNYYASIIGLGVVISVMLLMEQKERTIFSFLYYGGAIVLSMIVVLLNASRGASLAIASSVLLLIFMSKVKNKYKIIVIAFMAIMLMVLYTHGYFELLQVRVAAGNETAGGRTLIWMKKLDAFMSLNNPFEILFGVGFEKGFVLGTGYPRSFHSDYVCALVDYGVLGFSLFVTMLIMPVIKAPKSRRSVIFALVAYLWVIGLSLCPLTEGFLPYHIFLFYVFAKMQAFREQDIIKLN